MEVIDLRKRGSVWKYEAPAAYKKPENLFNHAALRDLASGKNRVDGAFVYSAIAERYIDEHINILPLREQKEALRLMEINAASIMHEIQQKMKAARSGWELQSRDLSCIDNALDYLAYMRNNPSIDAPHPYTLFARALRGKRHEVKERLWFEQNFEDRPSKTDASYRYAA